jgi:PTH2 family peptidyl-tRNA hydrolase
MNPVMYIVLNKGAEMSPGKLAAQAAHAAVEAYLASPDSNLKRVWHRGGHYTKIVLEARDAEHLCNIERYINERGFDTRLIIDEGRTEVAPHTPTALGVEIVDKHDAHVQATFGTFDLYREDEPDDTPTEKYKTPNPNEILGKPSTLTPNEFPYQVTWNNGATWFTVNPDGTVEPSSSMVSNSIPLPATFSTANCDQLYG